MIFKFPEDVGMKMGTVFYRNLRKQKMMGRLYDMFRNRIPIHDVEPSSVKSLLEAAGCNMATDRDMSVIQECLEMHLKLQGFGVS